MTVRTESAGDQSMSRLGWKGTLRAGTALGILIIATAQANAGAFAIREQSTYGQGTSFAGVAAGGSLSSMFWNPSTMTQFKGIVSESGFSATHAVERDSRRPCAVSPCQSPHTTVTKVPLGN